MRVQDYTIEAQYTAVEKGVARAEADKTHEKRERLETEI
jgi:hypothetical protein